MNFSTWRWSETNVKERMEEGECTDGSSVSDASSDEEWQEEDGRGVKVSSADDGKEEDGAILTGIRQELESKDMAGDERLPQQMTRKNIKTVGENSHKEEEEEEEQEQEDKVPIETLQSLGHCEVLQGMLANRHLRQLLTELDRNPAPQQALRRAMNIPVFTEFADQCLRLCATRLDDNQL